MAELIPISTYNLALKPFDPTPAIDEDFPVTIQITGAAIDPEAVDDKKQPSTLRILKKSDADDIDSEEGESDDEDDEEDDEDKPQSKLSKAKKNNDEDDEDEEDDDDEDDEEEGDEAITEHVLCTLLPETQYQFPLNITILPDEEVYFVATGSYTIHLHGNYIQHPADLDEDDYLDDSEDELDGLYPGEDYDEDDDEYDSEEMESNRIEELVDDEAEEEKPSSLKKRSADSESSASKKAKKAVQFSKELEQGPTGLTYTEGKDAKKDAKKEKKDAKKDAKKEDKKDAKKEDKKETKKEAKKESPEADSNGKKFPTKTLLGGVITEDRKVGSGKAAKLGQKVGIRYIGKLKNGKVFDKNTLGKPFSFTLGKGECIKGFDLGVAGMAIGGERRVIIPAKMGYGSQALPGIPANSELTFDIKLVSLK